jgi:hypothetical protein
MAYSLKLQDALFNWLQMKVVSEARVNDQAAKETMDFFEEILREDHLLSSFQVAETDETMYLLHYEKDGESKKQMFDRESADKLLDEINSNPKYNQ